MPESWTPSRRLQAAARAERDRLERELARLDAEHREHVEALRRIEVAQGELREELAMLDRLSHRDDSAEPAVVAPETGPRPTAEAQQARAGATALRGARIREAAVRLLADSSRRTEAIHYRDWYELFLAHGFVPAGANPLPTFLIQLGRSPVVRRSTQAGVYELDLDFPVRARRRLAELRDEFGHLHTSKAEDRLSSLVETRERRAQITAEIDQLERSLEEALRSLGEDADVKPLPAQAL